MFGFKTVSKVFELIGQTLDASADALEKELAIMAEAHDKSVAERYADLKDEIAASGLDVDKELAELIGKRNRNRNRKP